MEYINHVNYGLCVRITKVTSRGSKMKIDIPIRKYGKDAEEYMRWVKTVHKMNKKIK